MFILRRLCLLLLVIIMLSLLSFSLAYYTSHAPLAGDNVWHNYLHYLTQLKQGDFGVSSVDQQPILNQLLQVFPATIELCFIAFMLALLLGIPLGIIAGMNSGKWPDITINTVAMLGFSIPVFWLALLLILYFSLTLGWLPSAGRYSLFNHVPPVTGLALIDVWLSDLPNRMAILQDTLLHMILPIATLTLSPMTEVTRLMSMSTSKIFEQNYIKAASIRGLSRFSIIRRHLLHNALSAVVSKLSLKLSNMLTLAIVVEVVFDWPGVGRWLVIAIRQEDYMAISAGVLTIGILVIVINALLDIVSAITNPLKHKEWHAIR